MADKKCRHKYTSIGGQALIEGIMMKSPDKTAVAVRLPDGGIDISYMKETSVKDKFPILKLPVIRGVVGLIESMAQGYKALMMSAEKSGFADEEKDKQKDNSQGGEEKPKESMGKVLWGFIMAVSSVLAVILSVFLFMYIPALAFNGIKYIFGDGIVPFASLFEGVIKLIVLVTYMYVVSLMKDIKRVFMYHGAEHKTIFAYEKNLELTVENVRIQRRFHPRCGTSFLILMVLVSILISSVIAIAFPILRANIYVWVIIKILLIPLICGLGYELIRVCGKHDNTLTRIISAPGTWLQHITTKEPDDDMIEVAIAALNAVKPENPEEFQC